MKYVRIKSTRNAPLMNPKLLKMAINKLVKIGKGEFYKDNEFGDVILHTEGGDLVLQKGDKRVADQLNKKYYKKQD